MRFSAFLLGIVVTATFQSSSLFSLAQEEAKKGLDRSAVRRSSREVVDSGDAAGTATSSDSGRHVTGTDVRVLAVEDGAPAAHHLRSERNNTKRQLAFYDVCNMNDSPFRDGGVEGDCHRDPLQQQGKSLSGFVQLSEHACWGNHENKGHALHWDGHHVGISFGKDARAKCINLSGCDRISEFNDRVSSASWQFQDVHCDDRIRFYPDENCQGSYKEWPLTVDHFPNNFLKDGINDMVSSLMIYNPLLDDSSSAGHTDKRTVCPTFLHNTVERYQQTLFSFHVYTYTKKVSYFSAVPSATCSLSNAAVASQHTSSAPSTDQEPLGPDAEVPSQVADAEQDNVAT